MGCAINGWPARKDTDKTMFESTVNSPDNLIAGLSDVIAVEVKIASGEGVLGRGSVLGKITASGLYALVNSAGEDDGRRTAAAILAEDVDATDENVVTTAYIAGEFNENALVFGGTDSADDHRSTLQGIGIILRRSVEVN